MNVAHPARPVIKEFMRIGGQKVDAEGVVPVHYPYTNEVIGTVPAGTAQHAARAFEIARNYKPRLTRYERQQILFRTAELIKSRKDQLSDLITLELGLSRTRSTKSAAPMTSIRWRASSASLTMARSSRATSRPRASRARSSPSASRSASFPPSRPSTIRSTWSRTRWRLPSPPTTAWWPSPPS